MRTWNLFTLGAIAIPQVLCAVLHLRHPSPTLHMIAPRISQIVPPPEDTIGRSGQFPDGNYSCLIVPNDPDPYGPQKQCMQTCGQVTGSQDGIGPAIGCVGRQYSSGDHQGELMYQFDGSLLGTCYCGMPVVEILVGEVVKALPEIASIACNIFFDAVTSVLAVGASIGPVRLAETAVSLLLQGVATLTIEVADDLQFTPALTNWMDTLDWNPCPQGSSEAARQLQDGFDVVMGIIGGKGLKTGPRRPKGDSDSNTSPPAAPSVAPSVSTPTQTPGPSTEPASGTPSVTDATAATSTGHDVSATTTSSSSEDGPSCGLQARDNARSPGKSAWSSCDGNGNIQKTEITSMAFGNARMSTITRSCLAEHSHACAHYSSVLDQNPASGWDLLTCEDALGAKSVDSARPIVDLWNKQHHELWRNQDFLDSVPQSGCDRDEYPPTYFFKPEDPVIRDKKQFVRLLPARQNRGAGNFMWSGFCFDEGLQARDSDIQLENKNRYDSITTTVKDGKTTTTYITQITASLKFTPVYTAEFDLGNLDRTDYGLAENPCIPSKLAPMNADGEPDHLYPLLKNDPQVGIDGGWAQNYDQPPDQKMLNFMVNV